jgi:hypothetical protein
MPSARARGAPLVEHNVWHIAADGDGYPIDDVPLPLLIGAGGTRCPVYRELFRELNPRASELQLVTLEHEIEYDWHEQDCHLWFFGHGLPGYSWYVPKERGWLNVGVGAIAARIKNSGHDIRGHWGFLTAMLEAGFALGAGSIHGLSYYLRGNVEVRQRFITGELPDLRRGFMKHRAGDGAACARRRPFSRVRRTGWMMHRRQHHQHCPQYVDRAACAGALAGRRDTHPADRPQERHMALVTVINEHAHAADVSGTIT